MKPVISRNDYNAIKSLIANYPSHLKTKEVNQLVDELNRADILEDSEIGEDVIQLNTSFEAEDVTTKKVYKLTLTLPGEANVKEQKISIFSPLGVALIGFKKGMTIKWSLPGGMKTLKILQVNNPQKIN
jgi:regulator of nucleoside diphosphate kinase